MHYSCASQEAARHAAFFQMLALRRPEGGVPFNLKLYVEALTSGGPDPGAIKLACGLQCQLLNLWWDKLLRIKDANKMLMAQRLGLG